MNRHSFASTRPLSPFNVGDRVRLTKEQWKDIHLIAFEQAPSEIDVGVIRWCVKDRCAIDWGKSNLNSNLEWPLVNLEKVP